MEWEAGLASAQSSITLTQEVGSATPVFFTWYDGDVVYGRARETPEACGGPGYDWSWGIRPKADVGDVPVAYDDSMTSSLVVATGDSSYQTLSIVATSSSQEGEYEIELRVSYKWPGAQVLTMTIPVEIIFTPDPLCTSDILTIDPTNAIFQTYPAASFVFNKDIRSLGS